MAEAIRPMRHVSLPGMCPVDAAVAQMAESGIEERGAIFTRREVVDFILDLTGYTDDKPLHTQRLLEPSFGNGDFLLAAVERLLRAWHTADAPLESLIDSVRAIELHRKTFTATRARLAALLREEGLPDVDCDRLLDAWLVQGDFLLHPLPDGFHYVVGNPPYVRQELIPDALIAEYRRQFTTVFDRADIYIPFIERSLSLLAEGGALGFICADRWMKNRYGGPLRKMVAEGYRLKFYVDMVDTPAFHSEVIAYPAITVITRERPAQRGLLIDRRLHLRR